MSRDSESLGAAQERVEMSGRPLRDDAKLREVVGEAMSLYRAVSQPAEIYTEVVNRALDRIELHLFGISAASSPCPQNQAKTPTGGG
jgi:hypothetical protein